MKIGQLDTTRIVVTDFETYFDAEYSLRKMRTEEYILDKRFFVHGVAVADWRGKTDFIERADIQRWIHFHRHHTIVNHRLSFDGLVWKLGYNHTAPFMVDTLFLANAIFGPAEVSGGNDLESLAERLGFQPKGRVDMFSGRRDLTAEETDALRAYATNDADLTFKSFHALLPLLSRPEFELWLMDHTLRIYLNKPLHVISDKCSNGIKAVTSRVRACVHGLPKITFDFTWFKPRSKDGVKIKEKIITPKAVDESVLASNQQFGQALLQTLKKHKIAIPMKMGKNGEIAALAKADEGFVALKSSSVDAVRSLVIARLAKRSGDTQIARLAVLKRCAAAGGFRVALKYSGAHTGRWSGDSGLNAQNMPNPTRSSDEFERLVATMIRECIVPDKGRVFVATDAANIEARVLAAWAEQKDLVQAFGDGADVYSEFAAETFKTEVRKPKPEDSQELAKRFKLLRNVGKATILGLGYSMGDVKFEKNMRASPDVRQLFIEGVLNTYTCQSIVVQYRGKYKKIVELWGRCERAFHHAHAGTNRMVNGVLFSRNKNRPAVDVTLPCGHVIHYPDVRIGEHKGKHVQWVYGHGKGKKIYGGLLVENIVQAMSRDILAEGVWEMEHAGYPVAYHVHDSIVCHVPKKQAEKCQKKCIEVLSTAPAWMPSLRLGAESEITECFA